MAKRKVQYCFCNIVKFNILEGTKFFFAFRGHQYYFCRSYFRLEENTLFVICQELFHPRVPRVWGQEEHQLISLPALTIYSRKTNFVQFLNWLYPLVFMRLFLSLSLSLSLSLFLSLFYLDFSLSLSLSLSPSLSRSLSLSCVSMDVCFYKI